MFLRALILVFVLVTSFSSDENIRQKYVVIEISDDKCVQRYFRIKVQRVLTKKTINILSLRESDYVQNVHQGDIVKLALREMQNKEWNDQAPGLSQKIKFYCNGVLILEKGESFYKSDDLVGLQVVNPKNIKRKAKQ